MEVPTSPASIIASMSAHTEAGWKAPADADGPATVAEPDERPDPHAQWDEAHGRWIVWDAESGSWRPLGTDPPASVVEDRGERGGDPACWAHLVDDADADGEPTGPS